MKTTLSTDKHDKYIGRIRQMVLDFFADTPGRVYLFGSWARGTQRHGSDVDIAIDGGDAKQIGALREFLEESTVPYRVDVVDMRRASANLQRKIQEEGVVWK